MMSSPPEVLSLLWSLAPDLPVLFAGKDGQIQGANRVASDLLTQDGSMIGGTSIKDNLSCLAQQALSVSDLVDAGQSGTVAWLNREPECYLLLRAVEIQEFPAVYAISLELTGSPPDANLHARVNDSVFSSPEPHLSVAEEISEFGCFSWDVKQDILEWSDGMLRIFGIERAAFTNNGEAFFHRIHPEDQFRIAEAIDRAILDNGQFNTTERILRPGGELRWLESRGRLEVDALGTPSRLVGVCRDITESVDNASELRRQIDECNALQSQLLQAQKLEAIGKLTSGIAHDFNNLLTVISSSCELLDLLPEEAMREDACMLVKSVQDAGERGRQLTEQLLLYGRSSTGCPERVNLNSAVSESRTFLDRILGERISLFLSLNAEDPVVHIDPTQLQQILVNLALNARDAMPQGGQLTIDTDVCLRPPIGSDRDISDLISEVLLTVSDTGSGVSEEAQLHIFEPYYTTKPIGSGTGLGLSVIWGIVNAAGGKIEVDSEAGQGTRFCIRLPHDAGNTAQAINESKSGNAHGRSSILVVEDDAAIMEIIVTALEQSGYQVTGMSDPLEAIEFAAGSTNLILLLITDVSMPALSGPDLVASIRGARQDLPFPVLFTSGNDHEVLEKDYGIQTDANNFIQKPFRIAALVRKVEDALAGPST